MRHSIRLGLLLSLAAGCAGRAAPLGPREGSVHDALSGLGFAETGARSSASLDEGGTMQFPIRLEPGQCRAFVAMGSSRIRDLSVEVLRADGMRVARDENHSRNATAVYCASSASEVEVVVTAERGHGEVALHVYDAAGVRSGGSSYGSSCEGAEAIEVGAVVTGNTDSGRNREDGSCFQGDSPELYYQVTVAVPSMVTLDLDADYDAAIYVLRQCSGMDNELGCNDDFGSDRRHSQLTLELQPGAYVVVVDGYGGESGNFELRVTSEPLVPLAQLCADAPVLTPGQQAQGTTAGSLNRFRATCANGARGADRVHRLDVPQRSRVRIVQHTEDHDGALFLRRACEDESSELACNDDWAGTDASVITTTLDAGSYYVYSDSYVADDPSVAGAYTLQADLAPAEGTGGPSDTCGNAEAIQVNTPVTLDTFQARDDLRGSCGGQGGADLVRSLHVTARSMLRVRVSETQFNGHVYLRRGGCEGEELACRSFDEMQRSNGAAALETVLDPGDYFVVFDGADVESFGSLTANVELVDLAATQRACSEAPTLTPGRDERGTTAGRPSAFEASCAANAASPDRVYRLVLRRRSFVSLTLAAEGFDGALHLRRGDCSISTSEVACNDDDSDTAHSRIEGNFDAGTYYVIVDGYASNNAGAYTVRAEVGAERPNYQPPQPMRRGPQPEDDGGRLKPIGAGKSGR